VYIGDEGESEAAAASRRPSSSDDIKLALFFMSFAYRRAGFCPNLYVKGEIRGWRRDFGSLGPLTWRYGLRVYQVHGQTEGMLHNKYTSSVR